MEVTAKCPYCGRLSTYRVRPNVRRLVSCTCGKGSFYLRKVDRIEVLESTGNNGGVG